MPQPPPPRLLSSPKSIISAEVDLAAAICVMRESYGFSAKTDGSRKKRAWRSPMSEADFDPDVAASGYCATF